MKRLFVLRGQDEVWRNLLREMGERLKDGKALAVEVDDYKTNRSKAQFQFALPCEVKPTAGTSFGAGAGYTFT